MDHNSLVYIGIDAKGNRIEAHAHPTNIRASESDAPEGWEQILAFLPKPKSCLVVIETDINYYDSIVSALLDADHYVAIADSELVSQFAHELGILDETETTRASILAQYIERYQPKSLAAAHHKKTQTIELVARHRQLVNLCNTEKKRLEYARMDIIRQNLKILIETVEKYIITIEEEIKNISKSAQIADEKVELLIKIPEVGITTVTKMLAEVGEED